jgi:KDO2-lipid IV(A) lauroyltransferase
MPITVLYRPPKLKWLEPLMRAGRSRGYGKLAPTTLGGVRQLLRALRAGEAVGLLPDQVPGNGEGLWAEFFGRQAYTMTLVGKLQRATGCAVILAFARRLPGGRGFRLELRAVPDDLSGTAGARRLNAALEALIRGCPEQYLWSYNRFKVPAGAEPPP